MQPRTQYAKSGDVHIAYQVFGEGAVDLVFVPGFVSHIENYWDEPNFARWLRRLGNFSRVIMFDKRGTGLSDQVSELPGMDQRMDDVRAVMDAVGIERAAIFGISEGGSLATLFAASHPERSQALIIYGGFAQFSDWMTQEALESLFQYIDKSWGSGEGWLKFAPTKEGDLAFQQWWGKFERLGASPGAVTTLMRMNSQIDITEILPSVNVPTLVIHRKDDLLVRVEAGRLLAERIPGAKYVELSGADHLPFVGENSDRILDEMEHFLTGETSTPSVERVLATVVFTDIVGSTARAEALGDQAWGDLLDLHDKAVRKELERFRGNEVKWTGDGFLAAFDGPARAIQCALAIVSTVRALGIEVRAGIHTGEVDFVKNDIRGIAVHIASRVADLANAGDVVVSRTVKDLVAGSGIAFQDYGTHELKGVPDRWMLFRASG
ncbi:MAG: adenylate/guanylate cyclase domain-containing protein [Candidatus Dadabacteria bacterium]|jgi:class 3 adenylate cyclase|nr:MAG: adenylate/guanylate cyclase domain-containing protein [Candidatus Dadabacteria bacterium]